MRPSPVAPVRVLPDRADRSRPTKAPRSPGTTVLTGDALRVATCESGDHHGSYSWTARNRRTSASGAFEFVDGTWRSVTGRNDRAYQAPPEIQLAAFVKLWAGGRGAHNWSESRSCWDRLRVR